MAFISCPECKERISSTARACPKCGCDLTTDKNINYIKYSIEKEREENEFYNTVFKVSLLVLLHVFILAFTFDNINMIRKGGEETYHQNIDREILERKIRNRSDDITAYDLVEGTKPGKFVSAETNLKNAKNGLICNIILLIAIIVFDVLLIKDKINPEGMKK